MFIFLVDPDHPIEHGEDTLFRGFYCWNSEVGSQTFGLATFLYRFVCDNRLIWGAQDIRQLKIRHTRGAPERFEAEGMRYLEQYAQASTQETVAAIGRAKDFELDRAENQDGGWMPWLQSRGFSRAQASEAVKTAEAEQGEARSLWDIIQGG